MGGGVERDKILDPLTNQKIRYHAFEKIRYLALKNQISDIKPNKNQLSYLTPPTKIKYQISRYPRSTPCTCEHVCRSLRTIGAVVHGGSTIFCSGSPTGVRDVQRHLVFPVDFYILNGQIGHKKGISAKHWYVASFEIVQIH